MCLEFLLMQNTQKKVTRIFYCTLIRSSIKFSREKNTSETKLDRQKTKEKKNATYFVNKNKICGEYKTEETMNSRDKDGKRIFTKNANNKPFHWRLL